MQHVRGAEFQDVEQDGDRRARQHAGKAQEEVVLGADVDFVPYGMIMKQIGRGMVFSPRTIPQAPIAPNAAFTANCWN